MRTAPKGIDLTRGNLAAGIWKLALPTMVTSALYDLFNIVDMVFVGKLGPQAIAAVSISGVLMGLIRMGAMGISTGTVAMISRFVGQEDREAAQKVLGQSITLSLISSAVVALLGLLLAAPLVSALGAEEDVVAAGAAYLRIMCLGSITMFFSISLAAGMRGFGDAVTPMWALGIASLLNIGLDPLFIFGIGPFPRLEVAGSAIATVIARGVGSAILITVLLKGCRGIRATGFGISGSGLMRRIIKIGSFSALRSLGMNVSRLVLIRIIATFGTFAVAAFGIGMRLRLFVLILGFGLGNATAVAVGQNLGAGRPDRAERGAWLSVLFFGFFIVFASILFVAIPQAVIGIFNTNPQVVRYGTSFLYFFVPSLFLLDFSVILGRAIDGAGDTRATMIITGIALVAIGIPMAWGFSRMWGVNGVWAALIGSNAIQGLGMVLWFRTGRWKGKKV